MRRIRLIFYCSFCFFSTCLYAQDITNFTQFFINPYSINPSYAGIEGRGALFLAFRKQWSGIEGAPTIGSFTFHAPTKIGVNYGLNFSNDSRGLLKTSAAMLTAGYTVTIDKNHFIRFGISGGAAFNSVNADEFDNPIYDPNDPVLNELLDKNTYLIGNAGISVHLKSFHFGASLPNIFTPAYISLDAFSVNEVQPFQSVIIHASNRFYFAKDKNVFEPYLVYRMNEGLPSQLEAAAVLHLNHTLWFGGSYKQDFGISALGGIKLQNFLLIGASYSLKSTGVNELNSPSFEIQLGYIFGAKRKEIPVYSFVNTVKEKEKRKTPTQLAAERKKADEERKKIEAQKQQQELAKKQQEEAVKQQELAKKQQEELVKKQQEEAARIELAKKEEEAKRIAPVVVAPIVTSTNQQQQEVAKKQQEEAARIELAKKEEEVKRVAPVVVAPVVIPNKEPVKEPVVVIPPKRHDGGPRLKSDVLDIEMPNTYDTAHHEEQARIARIEEHAADPDEHHEEAPDFHPNAERHEFVKRGGHAEELEVGDYVIVGVFKAQSNADHFSDGLVKLGFEGDYGHLSEKNLWYVYVTSTNDINKAKAERDKFRKMKIFRDAWLLTVHH